MNKVKSLKKILMNILFYLVTIFLLLYIVLSVAAPNQVIDILQFQISSVPTDSMIPTIQPNDLILVVNTNPDKIEVGDIIIFQNYLPADSNGDNIADTFVLASIVHRVTDIQITNNEKIFITKGDNPNNQTDIIYDSLSDAQNQIAGTLVSDEIIGKYVIRVPYVGAIPYYVTQRFNPILAGLITLNIVIIVALVKVLKQKPQEEGKTDDLE